MSDNIKTVCEQKNVKVHLRPIEMDDVGFLYDVENDQTIWDAGLTNVPYSQGFLLEYILRCTCDIFTDKQVRLIVENEEGEPVGIIDLVNFEPAHCRAELGIIIKDEFRRRGYARAAVKQILKYGKETVHLHQVYAIVAKTNEKCAKMLEQVGFQRSMELKDWLYDGSAYHSAYFFQIFL